MKVKREYNKEQIIVERQNNVSSDIEESEDMTIEPREPNGSFMNEKDSSDSDGSIYFRNSRKRRRILESDTSDEEDLLDIRQYQRSPIWYVQKDNKFSGTPPPFTSPFGVDMSDRMVAHYPHSLKSKKFYHRIAFQFLNISITNSWILFNYDKEKKLSLLEFKASLANALIQIGERNKKRGRPCTISGPSKKCKSWIKVIPEIRLDSIGHYPLKVEHKNPPRCHDKNCTRRTRYICEKCKEPVCPDCMKSFHS